MTGLKIVSFLLVSVLGDSEFDVFTDDIGRQIVEICVADFNPHYQDHQLHGKPTGRAADAISICGGYVLLIMTALAVNTLI